MKKNIEDEIIEIEECETIKTKNLNFLRNKAESCEIDFSSSNNGEFTKIPLVNFSEIDKFLNLTSLLVDETRNRMGMRIKKDKRENSLLQDQDTNENLFSQIEIQEFFAEILEESNIDEAIILTKENFNLPNNYKLKVNLEITFAENTIIKMLKNDFKS